MHGLTFAAKDLFDVAGYVTGSGNPDWERTHAPARRHAWAVQALLDAGCTLAGKTITDEISLGLLGRNQFYGTPLNPRAPDRVPGGSSSGSASAVAGGLVDLALGTDSGGSVRTPASFCGLYGLRPTHGRIPVEGMGTQSPSFDTCGWFAADAETSRERARCCCKRPCPRLARPGSSSRPMRSRSPCPRFGRPWHPRSSGWRGAFPAASTGRSPAMRGSPLGTRTSARYSSASSAGPSGPGSRRCVPRFSIEVGRSLTLAMQVTEEDLAGPRRFREQARAALDDLLAGERVLCLPTVPILPPRRDEPFSAMVAAGRPDHRAHLHRRPHRPAAGQPAARRARGRPGRPVADRLARLRRGAAGRRPGPGSTGLAVAAPSTAAGDVQYPVPPGPTGAGLPKKKGRARGPGRVDQGG